MRFLDIDTEELNSFAKLFRDIIETHGLAAKRWSGI
jgi:hypothetical protein